MGKNNNMFNAERHLKDSAAFCHSRVGANPDVKEFGVSKESVRDQSIFKNKIASSLRSSQLCIGLFGFGCVGQGLFDVLNHPQSLEAEIGKICVKDKTKTRKLESKYFTFEHDDILNNDDNNLIVELIDDAEAAYKITGNALCSGKNVVSANKKMIAENFESLFRLQLDKNLSFLYEGACGGSIPIIRTLEEYYDNELLRSIKGILNGSSNYILTKMECENLSFIDALKDAQELGFAESNPWLDISGTDSKYKLCILCAHAFGIILKPGNIFNTGIQNITPFDINYAREKRLKIKLLANVEKEQTNSKSEKLISKQILSTKSENQYALAFNSLSAPGLRQAGEIENPSLCRGFGRQVKSEIISKSLNYSEKYRIHVLPHFIPQSSQLGNINYEFNGIEVEGVYSDKQFFVGKGAGSHPTGSAVLSDISAITYDYKYGYKKLKKRINGHIPDFSNDEKFIDEDYTIKLYIRYNNKSELNELEINTVDEEYSSSHAKYIVGNVGFSSLKKLNKSHNLFMSVI
jgi:homoserine dehydrogenase